ncbi:MAG TPA: NAD(P)/FAD-dependent oxidoreductase, partial [Firmicutes bacterium]|nr:NAD(P)/FAD-dependent oxidoreductase [Bacillota bacterium]
MQDRYDAIIVGAGIGGLLTGNFLVRKGLRTLLLEQHSQPGGYVCGFWRQGFYFDGGDQSFGSSGLVFPILEQLGLREAVRFVRADYRFHAPWADFKVDSLQHVQEALAGAFPAHRREIEAYFRELAPLVRGVCLFLDQPNPMVLPGWKKLAATVRLLAGHWRVLKTLGSFARLPGEELARRHFTDERLVEFFGRFGYRGSSALATAGAWGCWLYDYWYPVGGLQAFAELLARSFSEHGGEVRYRTRVTGIQTEGRPLQATGVLLEGGETLASRFVVY